MSELTDKITALVSAVNATANRAAASETAHVAERTELLRQIGLAQAAETDARNATYAALERNTELQAQLDALHAEALAVTTALDDGIAALNAIDVQPVEP